MQIKGFSLLHFLHFTMSFAPKICPNLECTSHFGTPAAFTKKGTNYIRRTHQTVRRFQCKVCRRYFSSRTFQANYRHKKMDLNYKLAKLLVEGCSLRACGRILGLNYSATYLKFLWLRKVVDQQKEKRSITARTLQFDEMESIEHTKCKPLSIALIVNESYTLLGAKVGKMPAKGRLAAFSRAKYGPRKDERREKMRELFSDILTQLPEEPLQVDSDQRPGYTALVREFFPKALYRQHNQAERKRRQERLHEKLQKKRYDPIFRVNHKCALLRSHMKRLVRRSWCTTKKPENLQLHLDLFVMMQFVTKF